MGHNMCICVVANLKEEELYVVETIYWCSVLSPSEYSQCCENNIRQKIIYSQNETIYYTTKINHQ